MESATNKRLVIYTILFTLALVTSALVFNNKKPPEIDLSGHPVLGNVKAPVQVVALEILDCEHCKVYMENVFPSLRKDYIDTGKVKYTPILSSFGWTSISTQTAYCILRQDSTLFFDFLDLAYFHQPTGDNFWSASGLLSLASQIPGINVDAVHRCIDNGDSILTIRRNFIQGKWFQATFHKSGVPMVFVNNKPVEPLTKERMHQIIQQELSNIHQESR